MCKAWPNMLIGVLACDHREGQVVPSVGKRKPRDRDAATCKDCLKQSGLPSLRSPNGTLLFFREHSRLGRDHCHGLGPGFLARGQTRSLRPPRPRRHLAQGHQHHLFLCAAPQQHYQGTTAQRVQVQTWSRKTRAFPNIENSQWWGGNETVCPHSKHCVQPRLLSSPCPLTPPRVPFMDLHVTFR